MEEIPTEVIASGRYYAHRSGIDEVDGISYAAEAWGMGEEHWKTVALRRCIDQRRKESGREGDDHRPIVLRENDLAAVSGEWISPCSEAGYIEVEQRFDLAELVGHLSDEEVAQLARVYWLGMKFPNSGKDYVVTMRALRRARRRAQGVPERGKKSKTAKGDECPLSPREREVLQAAAEGMTVKEIAAHLHLASNTIKTHLARISSRIEAANTTHAVSKALRMGWIS